jgi:hypothetical protein
MLHDSIPFLIVAVISVPLCWLGELFRQAVSQPQTGTKPPVTISCPYTLALVAVPLGLWYGFFGLAALGAAAALMGALFGESLVYERFTENSKREAMLKALVNAIKPPVATIVTGAVVALAWAAVVFVNRYFPLPLHVSIHWIAASLGSLTHDNVVRWLAYAATGYFTSLATAYWLIFRNWKQLYATTPRKVFTGVPYCKADD